MELELRHLRVLCAIADAGSVGRAASELGYSQPAMSTQLRRIERHFGKALFERKISGVELTQYGVGVLAQARDVLARADAIGRGPAESVSRTRRPLRLAATNSPVLSGMVVRLRSRLPDLALTVSSVYPSSEIVQLLEDGEVDAAIAADYPGLELWHSAAVAHRGIVTEPSFVALPSHHRLKHCLEVGLADLADDAWFVTPDDGAGWPGVFYAACESAGFTPAAVHEFLGDQLQLQNMIAEGLGVSIVQATLRPVPGVLIKPLTGTPLWCRYVLAWRRASPADEIADTLVSSATAAYRALIAQSPHLRRWASRTWSVTGPQVAVRPDRGPLRHRREPANGEDMQGS
ncbi:LysR family transcriptional regulator [Streptomyces sp. ISID311]|uniref:LysR family transcriptional regulator n=1 Tax=Streptomyces sp. ISID311 TaxID=2601673 RepID=UPI0011BD3A70|nr:LysR family transcriptional regulator [Streptomyces sp. ISID311]TXC98539.1 LysR family transcriptional regulator [Streptomyces sp. ISID311]